MQARCSTDDLILVSEYEELPANKILAVPCPDCGALLAVRQVDTPDFVVIDEEEIPGDK
jgi:hypothetical protein